MYVAITCSFNTFIYIIAIVNEMGLLCDQYNGAVVF